jgi:hypothetical protein
MWLKLAEVSSQSLAQGTDNRQFHDAKLATAHFYATRELPQSSAHRREIEAGAETVMAIPEEVF